MYVFNFNIKFAYAKRVEYFLAISLLSLMTSVVIASSIFFLAYRNKFYHGIYIESEHLGGLTRQQALNKLESKQETPQVILEINAANFKSISQAHELPIQKNYQEALDQAYQLGRTDFPLKRLWEILKLLKNPQKFNSKMTYKAEHLQQILTTLKEQVDIEGIEPSIELTYSNNPNSLKLNPGAYGRSLMLDQTVDHVLETVAKQKTQKQLQQLVDNQPYLLAIDAQIATTGTVLNNEQSQAALARAKRLVGKSITATTHDLKIILKDTELVSLLTLPEGYFDSNMSALLLEWETKVTREPTNAVFNYNPQTLEVYEFVPHKNGLTPDSTISKKALHNTLQQIERAAQEENNNQEDFDMEIAVMVKEPDIKLADTNDLGINELIGFGDSFYAHSIPSRIHNVKITTDKISGHIIRPGEEFSFNRTLGEVSRRTGYRPAYIIQGGRTVLGDGGGVCQVSTTTFRAVLDAGLPVTKRKAHSYRVSYYELDNKPGFDATVYSGDVDLRFVNDTGHYILLTGYADSDNVYMQISLYGNNDGRTTEIADYRMWGYSSPPASVYIPDPSLPTGVTKQIDWSSSGIKSEYTNVVRDKDGNIIREDYYYSNFRPWSAKFLQGI